MSEIVLLGATRLSEEEESALMSMVRTALPDAWVGDVFIEIQEDEGETDPRVCVVQLRDGVDAQEALARLRGVDNIPRRLKSWLRR